VTCGIPIPSGSDPFTVTSEAGNIWYHVFCNEKHPIDERTFNEGWGDTRFSPIFEDDCKTPVHTYYLASTPEGAIMESLLHDVPLNSPGSIELNLLSSFYVVTLALVANIDIVNLHSKFLPKLGLSRSQLIESLPPCYPETRLWAKAAYLQTITAQGIGYGSRRDDSARCLMIFRQRLVGLELEPTFNIVDVECLAANPRRAEVFQLAKRLGVRIL